MTSSPRIARRYVLLAKLAACGVFSCGIPAARAEHTVVVIASSDGGSSRVSGQVVDYTGRELRIRLPSGRKRIVPAADVESVETPLCAEHKSGDKLYAAGDFALAEAKYRTAVETDREVRGWVRRQILAQLAWCQQALSKWDQAGETFLALVRSDPTTQYFDCIPLAWIAAQPSTSLERKALAWLAADDPAAALVGASHLVATNRRPAALERLRSLAGDTDPRVAWLAQAQLWRVDAVRASPSDLERWSRAVESSDESLRAGPYFVLGSALAAHDGDAAAIALLELPLMYPRQRPLSAAALLLAGRCLEKSGRKSQAAALYRELINGYEGAAETGEARRRLEGL